MYIVSACLAGINCRYDGRNCFDQQVVDLMDRGEAIPLCPEVLGGLSIPRNRCELVTLDDGTQKIVSDNDEDFTEEYLSGAEKVLQISKTAGVDKAIMKEDSPSCGLRRIYDGTFSDIQTDGTGVTSKLLIDNNIAVYTEEDL